MTSQQYHHGDLPQTLMSLALKHIEESGTESLSLRALARDAGVSATAPYRHFPSKHSLLAAVATEGFRALRAQLEAAVSASDDPWAQFLAVGTTYIRQAQSNPTTYQLMFGSVLGDFSQYDDLQVEAAATFSVVEGVAQRLINSRELSMTANQLAGAAWAAVHGIASLSIDGRRRDSRLDVPPMRAIRFIGQNPTKTLEIMFEGLLQ